MIKVCGGRRGLWGDIQATFGTPGPFIAEKNVLVRGGGGGGGGGGGAFGCKNWPPGPFLSLAQIFVTGSLTSHYHCEAHSQLR